MEPKPLSQSPRSEKDSALAANNPEEESKKEVQDPWKDKSSVLEQVTAKVDRITAFRQQQFSQKRQEISQAMQEKEKLEVEAEAKRL